MLRVNSPGLSSRAVQPQKKKKDRRKGKGGDANEDDEDNDVMEKLKKLSVQASDEEDEPGTSTSTLTHSSQCVLICSVLSHCSLSFCPQLWPPAKETRRIRFVVTLCSDTLLHLLLTFM